MTQQYYKKVGDFLKGQVFTQVENLPADVQKMLEDDQQRVYINSSVRMVYFNFSQLSSHKKRKIYIVKMLIAYQA